MIKISSTSKPKPLIGIQGNRNDDLVKIINELVNTQTMFGMPGTTLSPNKKLYLDIDQFYTDMVVPDHSISIHMDSLDIRWTFALGGYIQANYTVNFDAWGINNLPVKGHLHGSGEEGDWLTHDKIKLGKNEYISQMTVDYLENYEAICNFRFKIGSAGTGYIYDSKNNKGSSTSWKIWSNVWSLGRTQTKSFDNVACLIGQSGEKYISGLEVWSADTIAQIQVNP